MPEPNRENQQETPATPNVKRVPSWLATKLVAHKNVSMRVLNTVIGIGLVLIVAMIIWGASRGGFTIAYEPLGGTPVSSVKAKHGEKLTMPQSTREGFRLSGWYHDRDYKYQFNFATDKVTGTITLYAKWEKLDQK